MQHNNAWFCCFFAERGFPAAEGKHYAARNEMLIIFTCIAGVLLGLTYSVFVLLPLTLIGGAAYAFLFGAEGPTATILAIAMLAFSLQAGYMLGLMGRFRLIQLRSRLGGVQSKRV